MDFGMRDYVTAAVAVSRATYGALTLRDFLDMDMNDFRFVIEDTARQCAKGNENGEGQ
jgi:hypothetical protein